MSDSQSKDPKIVVDDDWKAQVEAEKGKAQTQPQAASSTDRDELPPASFPILISTLASQALAGLGAIPDPIENKPVVRLEMAKHMIDTLAILEDKTQGNLSPQESEMLTGTLHQLRLAFMSVKSSSGGRPAGGGSASQIELP